MYEPVRKMELFIVMTMYNEDEELFTCTMQGVIRNVAHLCTHERSKTWGKEGWKRSCALSAMAGRRLIRVRCLLLQLWGAIRMVWARWVGRANTEREY